MYSLILSVIKIYPMEEIISMFKRWITNKINIHLSEKIVYFKERQIWWVALGQNVGSEQNGKHENFERPVLILKKYNADMFLAVPTTSKTKNGAYRYVIKTENNDIVINFSQMRTLSRRRLIRPVGDISKEEFEKIKQCIKNSL